MNTPTLESYFVPGTTLSLRENIKIHAFILCYRNIGTANIYFIIIYKSWKSFVEVKNSHLSTGRAYNLTEKTEYAPKCYLVYDGGLQYETCPTFFRNVYTWGGAVICRCKHSTDWNLQMRVKHKQQVQRLTNPRSIYGFGK